MVIRPYEERLFKVAAEKRLWLLPLGQIEDETMWLVRSRGSADHPDPKMLIVAGFHGEEKAGPYAILDWLENNDSAIFKRVDISFIPIVNPIGFKKNIRYSDGQKSNGGFGEREKKPSREGEILIRNIEILFPLAKDGFLSLHEDKDETHYYVYTFEKGRKRPTKFTLKMRDNVGQFFTTTPFTGMSEIDGSEIQAQVKNGICFNYVDGSFESWLYLMGVPRCVVTETPQNGGKIHRGQFSIKNRVNAGISSIDKFIELTTELVRKERRMVNQNG